MSDWHDQRPVRTATMSAKEEILARVRAALAEPRTDTVTEASDVPRSYQRADDRTESTDRAKVLALLVSRLEDYTAQVTRTDEAGVPQAVAAALAEAGSVVIPPGLPEEWMSGVAAPVRVDDGELGPRDLDAIDAVVTGSHTAVATTGTIILRSDDVCGRRILTLVPDSHVVIVRAGDVTVGVPRAIARMDEDPRAAWTMISGPSATSDIELSRVEGVHGPRRLHVILVDDTPEPEPQPESQPQTQDADQQTPQSKE